jgi:hypothetical protein
MNKYIMNFKVYGKKWLCIKDASPKLSDDEIMKDERPGKGHITCTEEMRNGYTFWSEILKERDHLEGLGRWKNNLKIDLNEIWWGSAWLRIGTSCKL